MLKNDYTDSNPKLLQYPGICTSCGFLGLWDDSSKLVETPEHFRLTGQLTSANLEGLRRPICAVFRADFKEDIKKILPRESDSQANQNARRRSEDEPSSTHIFTVIKDESRNCERTPEQPQGWYKWRPGFSPKEHVEMLDREFMLKREDARDRSNKHFKYLEVALFVLVAIAAAVLGGYIERSGNQPDVQRVVIETPTAIPPTPTQIPPTQVPDTEAGTPQATQ